MMEIMMILNMFTYFSPYFVRWMHCAYNGRQSSIDQSHPDKDVGESFVLWHLSESLQIFTVGLMEFSLGGLIVRDCPHAGYNGRKIVQS